MKLGMRLLTGIILLHLPAAINAASTNFSAFNLQSSNLNTNPFRGYDDRPDDCPPWFALKSPLANVQVSTVSSPRLNVKTTPPATNSTANANVLLASAETTVSSQVTPHHTKLTPSL